MAKIHYGLKTSRKQGGQKMAKMQYGVKPDIFKYAPTSFRQFYFCNYILHGALVTFVRLHTSANE